MPLKTPAAQLAQPALIAQDGPARALDLETLFFIRGVMGLNWSADSSYLFFETNFTGRYNLWRVPAAGGWPIQLTVSDDRTELVDSAADGRSVLFAMDKDGNEKPNLWLIDPAGGPAYALTHTEKIGYNAVHFDPSGTRVAYAAELEGPGRYGIYVTELPEKLPEVRTRRPKPRLLVPAGDRMWAGCTWTRDGKKLAVTHTTEGLHHGLCVVDVDAGDGPGALREILPNDGLHTIRPVDWDLHASRLLINSNLGPNGQMAPGLLHLNTGYIEWLVESPWEAVALDWSADGRWIVWKLNQAGNERVFLLDMATRVSKPIGLEAGVYGAARFSPDNRMVAVHYGTGDRPTDTWIVPMDGSAPYQVTFSIMGGMNADDFVRPHLITYPAEDGTPIAAFLYLPRGAKPDGSHPGIVHVRGGPTAQTQNRFLNSIQFLVNRGFVVIAPNYRGSTGFGTEFQESNRRDLGGMDLRDIAAGRQYLIDTGFVDAERVAVMGGSYGGYLTLMALTKTPDLWAAGVAIVPFANWFTEYENEDETLQAFDREMMGDPVENRAFWTDRSPYFFVDRIQAPLLMLAGGNDIRCPASETRDIEAKIRERGGIVEAKIYENEGHGFLKRENAIDAFQRQVSFLERHLRRPGEQALEPGEAAGGGAAASVAKSDHTG